MAAPAPMSSANDERLLGGISSSFRVNPYTGGQGIVIVSDVEAATPDDSAEDGWIYNPKSGETYSANVEAVSPDRLKVRGYLGVSLLGKSQIWTRVPGDRGGCRI